MSEQALNERLIADSVCFGCGPSNSQGLKLKVDYDPNDPEKIIGLFLPDASLIGFPGITHGGIVFTALDCIACWSGMMLTKGPKALWLLRSAQVTYHRPAREGEPLYLSATIPNLAEAGRVQTVHNEARNESGDLLVNGQYKIVPLSPKKFMTVLGVKKLPEGWASWLKSTERKV